MTPIPAASTKGDTSASGLDASWECVPERPGIPLRKKALSRRILREFRKCRELQFGQAEGPSQNRDLLIDGGVVDGGVGPALLFPFQNVGGEDGLVDG